MKNINSSIKYITKNFLTVLLFSLLPAIFVGAFSRPFGISNFLVKYRNMPISNIGSILGAMFNFTWVYIVVYIFACLLIILFVSAYLGSIENHFRSGKINLNDASSYINSNIVATLAYLIFINLLYMAYKFLLAVTIFTTHILFSGLNNQPTLFNYIFVFCLIIFTFVVFAYLFNYFLLALPITLSSGYNIRTSLFEANELLSKKHTKTMIAIVLPISFVFSLAVLGGALNIFWLTNILGIFIMISYYPILAYVIYYDYAYIKRYDVKTKYYYK